MLGDTTKALAYFQEEYEFTFADDKPLAEHIAPDVCRVNLGAWKRLGLNPDWLWSLFSENSFADSGNFDDYLAQASSVTAEWAKYIADYKVGPVHHSEAYREKEKPAYRILSGWTVSVLPLLEAMAGLTGGVIAIDGRAASGKSTFAQGFADVIFGNKPIIIKMDDFFLPSELRTPERLAQPGGNIHYERFAEEVLPNIRSGKGFEYRKFDCGRMDYDGTVEVPPHLWRIVEGVYSCHPAHGDYMDIQVFMDVTPDVQRKRIGNRNNPTIAATYIEKWIPMEEAYFNAFAGPKIHEKRYIFMDTSGNNQNNNENLYQKRQNHTDSN
ncbi:MAG: hypothetical protein FWC73_03845 [Defluviitaleaceae bacterium]|nr:hypothetical protein [Defluviitaleaceae bacterium]